MKWSLSWVIDWVIYEIDGIFDGLEEVSFWGFELEFVLSFRGHLG